MFDGYGNVHGFGNILFNEGGNRIRMSVIIEENSDQTGNGQPDEENDDKNDSLKQFESPD